MGDREGGDHLGGVPETRGYDQQREKKQQVVVAGQDVLDAEPQDAPEPFEPGELRLRLVDGDLEGRHGAVEQELFLARRQDEAAEAAVLRVDVEKQEIGDRKTLDRARTPVRRRDHQPVRKA